jgi:small subunit ribosomal protein S29
MLLIIFTAQELSGAVNDYAAIPGTTPTLWSQPTYTANWLAQIGKANSVFLQNTKYSGKRTLPFPVAAGISLARLCELGTRDPDAAWAVFQAVWADITMPGKPPILMTLDGLSYIMADSEYRDPAFNKIHTHDFAIAKHFLDYLSGSTSMPNGGAVIAATSRSHHPVSLSMELAITQSLDRAQNQEVTSRDPFERKYDERADKALQRMSVMKLGGLSRQEARGLMEYWAASGVLRQRVDEQSVAEKWALAGGGIVGEIQRGALRMRI